MMKLPQVSALQVSALQMTNRRTNQRNKIQTIKRERMRMRICKLLKKLPGVMFYNYFSVYLVSFNFEQH
jgi:hypothetical protein